MKKKVIVIAWDVVHNAVGRAYLLLDLLSEKYDTKLIGFKFPHFGKELWEPLRNQKFNGEYIVGGDLKKTYENAIELIKNQEADYVIVCKPRIPSILLGILLKRKLKIPIIIDIDDSELSFFNTDSNLTLDNIKQNVNNKEIEAPYSKIWTQYADNLIGEFDEIIVSNEVLQKKYGGTIITHVKDERKFIPNIQLREQMRKKLGFKKTDKIVVFAGTPRRHKGILEITKALKSINNPNYHLCVFGAFDDKQLYKEVISINYQRIHFYNNFSFNELPKYLSIADLSCILQKEDSEISKFQIPAKLIDAISMNVPVLTTKAPPVLALSQKGLFFKVISNQENLSQEIDNALKNSKKNRIESSKNRKYFLDHLSYKRALVKISNIFNQLPSYSNLNSESTYFLDFLKQINREKKDIVFFWKQNDSGIYGRRQDMIVKYLSKRLDINKIVHFDSPISINDLIKKKSNTNNSQDNKIYTNTLNRLNKKYDTESLINRTFVYYNSKNDLLKYKEDLSSIENIYERDEYANFIKNELEVNNIDPNTAIFWFCPIINEFEEIINYLKPSIIISDVIDDQRAWSKNEEQFKKITNQYKTIISKSNLIISNCRNTHNTITQFGNESVIIENGFELFNDKEIEKFKCPVELKAIKGKIIGYVGNLDPKRLDINLLEDILKKQKDWNVVLIGSTHMGKDILEIAKNYDNLHILGIKEYPSVLNYIKYFDICIIPHLNNYMTRNMNPLKLYVYASLNKKIISTNLEGLNTGLEGLIIADNAKDFINLIDYHLKSTHEKYNLDVSNTWEYKVNSIVNIIDIKLNESINKNDKIVLKNHINNNNNNNKISELEKEIKYYKNQHIETIYWYRQEIEKINKWHESNYKNLPKLLIKISRVINKIKTKK